MVASMFSAAILTILSAFAQDYAQLLAIRAALGIALGGMPAVAMAMVSQLEMATSCKNSSEWAGGTKLARNCQVAARLCASHKIHGLNSACTSIGHSTSSATAVMVRRPRQAGSRGMAVLVSKAASRHPASFPAPRARAPDRPCCGTVR
ncbi:MAG: hypothetical protein RSH52_13085 [Janthinobacterium sp.]